MSCIEIIWDGASESSVFNVWPFCLIIVLFRNWNTTRKQRMRGEMLTLLPEKRTRGAPQESQEEPPGGLSRTEDAPRTQGTLQRSGQPCWPAQRWPRPFSVTSLGTREAAWPPHRAAAAQTLFPRPRGVWGGAVEAAAEVTGAASQTSGRRRGAAPGASSSPRSRGESGCRRRITSTTRWATPTMTFTTRAPGPGLCSSGALATW